MTGRPWTISARASGQAAGGVVDFDDIAPRETGVRREKAYRVPDVMLVKGVDAHKRDV